MFHWLVHRRMLQGTAERDHVRYMCQSQWRYSIHNMCQTRYCSKAKENLVHYPQPMLGRQSEQKYIYSAQNKPIYKHQFAQNMCHVNAMYVARIYMYVYVENMMGKQGKNSCWE